MREARFKNSETIIGRVYSHDLELKKVKNQESANYGKDFIGGKLHIAVDEEGINVIEVDYTYVTPLKKDGNPNESFNVLNRIISTNATWESVGKENALIVKISTNLDVNDFIDREDKLVSYQRNSGGFISFATEKDMQGDCNKFILEMIATNVRDIESSDGSSSYIKVKGYAFNYKKEILPVEFSVKSDAGISYFEGLDVSQNNPSFLKVWGVINNIVTKEEVTEEGGFGEALVTSRDRKQKEWVIVGGNDLPLNEENITLEEFVKAKQNRELKEAEVRKNHNDYQARRVSGATAATSFGATPPNSFNGFPVNQGTFNPSGF